MKITTSLGILRMRLPKGGLALAGFVILMVAVLACKKEVEAVATSLKTDPGVVDAAFAPYLGQVGIVVNNHYVWNRRFVVTADGTRVDHRFGVGDEFSISKTSLPFNAFFRNLA